jgi:hypothetical protein
VKPSSQTQHLWEIDHPYYCEPGNFFKNGQHTNFDSWQQFVDETLFATGDPDLNLLFRWDWHKPGHHDWDGPEQLLLFFVLQRKSFNCSVQIAVTEADEPAVRAWLAERAKTITAIWAPITLPESEKPFPPYGGHDATCAYVSGMTTRCTCASEEAAR